MTIATTTSRVDVPGNGFATSFSFAPVVIFDPSDLQITVRDSSGNETAISQGAGSTNYSIIVTSYPGVGSIVYPASGGTPLPSGSTLVIKRIVPLLQSVSLGNQGAYFPKIQEGEFDYLTAIDQQQQEQINRSVQLPSTETGPLVLPNKALRANQYATYDSQGNLGAGLPLVGTATVSAAMQAIINASTLPGALALLGTFGSFDTIAALRANVATQPGIVFVNGYHTVGDAGSGIFWHNTADTTGADDGGTVIVDGAGNRWHRRALAPFNVVWFGAKVDSSTDDSAALAACIAAASSARCGIYIPAGGCVCHSISVPANMSIIGAGRWVTSLINNSLTADTLVATGGFNNISEIGFTTSVTKTAGTYVNFGAGTNNTLDNFIMYQYYVGIAFGGGLTQILNGLLENGVPSTGAGANTGGIIVGAAGDGDALVISNVVMTAPGGSNPSFGIWVLSCGDIIISNCNIMGHGVDLLASPAPGASIASLWATNTFFDTATNGIVMQPVGSGSVARCRFDSCWTSSHSGHGVILGGEGGAVTSVHFTDHEAINNTANSGLTILSGTADITVNGGLFAGNNIGVFVDAGVSNFSVVNASLGAYGGAAGNANCGVSVTTGASDQYIIANNRCHGNGVTGISDGGSGGDKFVGNNV